MENKDKITSAEVYNGPVWQAQMVINLLQNAGVEAFLQNEASGSLHLPWASPGGVGEAKVVVSGTNYEKARKIVEEYENNSDDAPDRDDNH